MARSAAAILLLCLLASAARAEHRFALIIGNSQYKEKTIQPPAKDLKAVAAALAKHARTRLRAMTGYLVEDSCPTLHQQGHASQPPGGTFAFLVCSI